MFSNPSALLASLLFGAVGFVAFMYGKKMALWRPMVFGGALMVYPYFVPQTWLIYTIGCALCLGLGAVHLPRLSTNYAERLKKARQALVDFLRAARTGAA